MFMEQFRHFSYFGSRCSNLLFLLRLVQWEWSCFSRFVLCYLSF
jgi:hypothetical protein